jgi:hypothetical protein
MWMVSERETVVELPWLRSVVRAYKAVNRVTSTLVSETVRCSWCPS